MRLTRSTLPLLSILLLAAGTRAAPPPKSLAEEILADSGYQRELVPAPARPERTAGCDRPGSVRLSAGAGGGSVTGLLAWLGVGVAVALALIWLGSALNARRRQAAAAGAAAAGPAAAAGRRDASLERVERLAAAGRHAEAVHELLLLAVDRLSQRHQRPVSGWHTARELMRLLPADAGERERFGRLVAAVERSLFGGHPVDARGFERCLADFRAMELAA